MTSGVAHILIEEQLGYNVVETGPGQNALSAFFALAGCEKPHALQDQGCGLATTRNHVNLECWAEGYAAEWKLLEYKYPYLSPVSAGSMGYEGLSSTFLRRETLTQAFLNEGAILDYFRGWNTTWTQPWNYFDGLPSVNRSQMAPAVKVYGTFWYLYMGYIEGTEGLYRGYIGFRDESETASLPDFTVIVS